MSVAWPGQMAYAQVADTRGAIYGSAGWGFESSERAQVNSQLWPYSRTLWISCSTRVQQYLAVKLLSQPAKHFAGGLVGNLRIDLHGERDLAEGAPLGPAIWYYHPRTNAFSPGGWMERSGQMLFWTILGSVAAVVSVLIGLTKCSGGSSPGAALPQGSSIGSPTSTAVGSAHRTVGTAGTPSIKYLADMTPGGALSDLVTTGLVQIFGRTYPKSIEFTCGTDPGDTPGNYSLNGAATKFKGTVGLEDKWSTTYIVGMSVVGDGRTLKTFKVSVLRPRTISVNVTNVQILQLECSDAVDTSSQIGATYPAAVAWGNARVVERT
ncbi:MAG TPA: NPCBM/NEW2 domain-containing protein [Candidatus Binatia bacterium]|nr:NPCBM/NEW2 domain-containing protein [Candidatus Binatia bacterium]